MELSFEVNSEHLYLLLFHQMIFFLPILETEFHVIGKNNNVPIFGSSKANVEEKTRRHVGFTWSTRTHFGWGCDECAGLTDETLMHSEENIICSLKFSF